MLYGIWPEDAAIGIFSVDVDNSVDGPVSVLEFCSMESPLDGELGARNCFDVPCGLSSLVLFIVVLEFVGWFPAHVDLDVEAGQRVEDYHDSSRVYTVVSLLIEAAPDNHNIRTKHNAIGGNVTPETKWEVTLGDLT